MLASRLLPVVDAAESFAGSEYSWMHCSDLGVEICSQLACGLLLLLLLERLAGKEVNEGLIQRFLHHGSLHGG